VTIRAITFDLWNTLLGEANTRGRREMRCVAFSRASGVPVGEVREAWEHAVIEFERCHRDEQRTLHAGDYVEFLCQSLGVTLSRRASREVAEVFAVAILDHPPVPVDGALEAVRAAARRFPLALISDTGNSPGRVLRQLMERCGFLQYFRVGVFSDEEGACKPAAGMFEAAARGLGVPPADLLHIGDLEYSDIAGAHALGARAALFAGVNREFLGCTEADYVFTSWREFLELLPSLDRMEKTDK